MKYGLIIYKDTNNIGDDVQSYAMERFLPHVDYIVDREHLDSFYTETGEKIAAIFAGWYLHSALNWPPSPFLKVLPISIHFDNWLDKCKYILDDCGVKWLKDFSPIGCLDEGTLKRLEECGISSYLSGCITLTLEPFKNLTPHGKIVLSDVPESVIEFVKAHTKKEVVVTSHDSRKLVPFFSENTPVPQMTWTQRHALIEKLLKLYQGASLVVTNRLHAALPCLALGTPVLLVTNLQSNYRISTYIPYLNNTTPKDLIDGKYQFNFDEPKANPSGHEKFAVQIRKACKDFIRACENADASYLPYRNRRVPKKFLLSFDAPKVNSNGNGAEEQKSTRYRLANNSKALIDVEAWLDGHERNNRLKKIITSLNPQDRLLSLM